MLFKNTTELTINTRTYQSQGTYTCLIVFKDGREIVGSTQYVEAKGDENTLIPLEFAVRSQTCCSFICTADLLLVNTIEIKLAQDNDNDNDLFLFSKLMAQRYNIYTTIYNVHM